MLPYAGGIARFLSPNNHILPMCDAKKVTNLTHRPQFVGTNGKQ